MRWMLAVAFALVAPVLAQSSAESDAVAVVQKLFDAMVAHDADAIRAVVLPDARLTSVRDDGEPSGMAAADFAARIGSSKSTLRERFTGKPKVLVHGRVAQVWGEYEFERDGKFTHCGVDTVTLFKTAAGWKIGALLYSVETTGCAVGLKPSAD